MALKLSLMSASEANIAANPPKPRTSAESRMKQALSSVRLATLNLSYIASVFMASPLCSCSSGDCAPMEMPYTDGILYEPKDEKKWKCICRLAKRLDYKTENIESIKKEFGRGLNHWEKYPKLGKELFIERISYQYFTKDGDCERLIFSFDKEGHLVNVSKQLDIGGAYIPPIQISQGMSQRVQRP